MINPGLKFISFLMLMTAANFDCFYAQPPANQKKGDFQDSLLHEKRRWQLNLVRDTTFLIKVKTVYDQNYNSYVVNPSTNFVKLDHRNVIIQLAFEGLIGLNNLGGITVNSNLLRYEVNQEKKDKPIIVRMETSSASLGPLSLVVRIYADGSAQTDLLGNFGKRMKFTGDFFALSGSSTYMGTPDY